MRMIDGDRLLRELTALSHGQVWPGWTYEGIRLLIERQPTLTPPNEWVSVEDRLPKSQADVLVVAFWHERWQTMIGWHSDMGKKWRVITPHGEREPGGVTHWMPLPASPDKDNNVPGKTQNEPLTLEQLREMDGKPVWGKSLINDKPGEWFILRVVEMSKTWFVACAGSEQGFGDKDTYGTTWLAYAYPHAHIDRETWKPCNRCKACSSCVHFLSKDSYEFCKKCITGQEHMPLTKYCPSCGRPLTPEAWEELEKRIGGAV